MRRVNEPKWPIAGLLTMATGGFLRLRPVVELPARVGVWLVLADFLVGHLGSAMAAGRSKYHCARRGN